VRQESIAAIVQALNAADARYLIVGGLAVVAHGYVRFTADLDLVLDPEEASLKRAVAALSRLGYKPRAPVPFSDFEDSAKRMSWARDKGMTVFSLFSSDHAATEIDLFVDSPFDFERAYSRAARMEVAPEVTATFVSREDLIAMKQKAGRQRDLEDIEGLLGVE
jgi:hypothetical protein